MDKIKPEQGYGVQRLQSKDARSAIVQRLAVDFNLTPIIAEAFYQQFSMYYQEHANVALSSGEIAYEAVSAEEPAGKHIRLTKKVTVRLKLIDFNTDLQALAEYGLAGLRQHRLARLTRQAYDQGALLSYEDLAMILSSSPATVRRDVYALNHNGMFVITRGAKLDMGPGLSHKTTIIDYYFKGYSFTEIERITNHSEVSVKRYLADFVQVAALYKQQFSANQIRLIAQNRIAWLENTLSSIKPIHLKTMSGWITCLPLNYLTRLRKKKLNLDPEVKEMIKPLTKEQVQLKVQ